MEQPDAKEFARNVMWHLAGLRADMEVMERTLAEVLSHQTGKPAMEFLGRWPEERKEHQKSLYREALVQSGIVTDLDDDEDVGEDPGPGTGRR